MEIPAVKTTETPIDTILATTVIPSFYSNGFVLGNTLTEGTIVFQFGSRPIVALNLSFAALKSLKEGISEMIANVEKGNGDTILNLQETQLKWAKNLTPEK